MGSEFSRRRFLQGSVGAAAVAGYMQINPDFFISSAFAQAGKTMTFLSAENITGNWDPTAHTTLSQKNIEGFVMGFLTRTPMKLDDPIQILDRQRPIEAHLVGDAVESFPRHARRESKLRQGPARRKIEDRKSNNRNKQQEHKALPYAV
ncbi:hypothetical protein J2S28_004831 [Rhizobium sp. SLBN-94]|nr:hypothetical protein [Rhizobium sp. SLBN-94]